MSSVRIAHLVRVVFDVVIVEALEFDFEMGIVVFFVHLSGERV
jgi:hypothetical protein